MRPALQLLVLLLVLTLCILAASCKKRPELTCKVNDQCFVCPDEKAKSNCPRDPTSSRCKWAEPSHCSASTSTAAGK